MRMPLTTPRARAYTRARGKSGEKYGKVPVIKYIDAPSQFNGGSLARP
jgi:hypothetical protein